jgi:hypothetical protein
MVMAGIASNRHSGIGQCSGMAVLARQSPSIRIDQWPLLFGSVCRLVDGFRSAIAGMFSDYGPLSGNTARKMD